MTRQDKVKRKKERANRRADKRNAKYREFLRDNTDIIRHGGFSAAKQGVWADSNSPTGYSQQCSYYGTCQSPCNGDC